MFAQLTLASADSRFANSGTPLSFVDLILSLISRLRAYSSRARKHRQASGDGRLDRSRVGKHRETSFDHRGRKRLSKFLERSSAFGPLSFLIFRRGSYRSRTKKCGNVVNANGSSFRVQITWVSLIFARSADARPSTFVPSRVKRPRTPNVYGLTIIRTYCSLALPLGDWLLKILTILKNHPPDVARALPGQPPAQPSHGPIRTKL
jgi:hypothetical protein